MFVVTIFLGGSVSRMFRLITAVDFGLMDGADSVSVF